MCLYVSMCVHVYSRRLPSSSAGVYMCLYVSMKARAQDILQRLLFSFSMSHHHTYNVTSSYAQDILQRLLCSFFSFFFLFLSFCQRNNEGTHRGRTSTTYCLHFRTYCLHFRQHRRNTTSCPRAHGRAFLFLGPWPGSYIT